MVDSRWAGGKRRECAASLPLPPSLSRARKDARGMLGTRWTTRIHIPTAVSRVQGLQQRWGTVRGTLEGWGCYIRPARGGESSVRPTGAYRSRRIRRTIVAPGDDGAHLAFAGCTHAVTSATALTNENVGGTLEDLEVFCQAKEREREREDYNKEAKTKK